MKVLVMVVLVLVCLNAKAADKWTDTDSKFQEVYTVVTLVDMFTTLDIKNNSNVYETNPVLGPHPSDIKVISIFALGMGLTYEVATLLPKDFRRAFQIVSTVIELKCVNNNLSIGLLFAL
jgi:hypothetical protein